VRSPSTPAILIAVGCLVAFTEPEPPLRVRWMISVQTRCTCSANPTAFTTLSGLLPLIGPGIGSFTLPTRILSCLTTWHATCARFGTVTDAEIRADYAATLRVIADVQASERKLIRWLGKYNGVSRVFREALTDADMAEFDSIIRDAREGNLDAATWLAIGAPGQALLLGHIESVEPAEDEAAYRRAPASLELVQRESEIDAALLHGQPPPYRANVKAPGSCVPVTRHLAFGT
jgi:hypothetical protein